MFCSSIGDYYLYFTILYVSFTSTFIKSTLEIAQDNLLSRSVDTMTYFAHSTSFYLYPLTGTIFRKEFYKIIGRCWHNNRNRVHITRARTHSLSLLQSNRQNIVRHNIPRRY